MSIHFSQGKLQGQERIRILQEVQKQAKAAALQAINPLITAFLEAEHPRVAQRDGLSRELAPSLTFPLSHCAFFAAMVNVPTCARKTKRS